MSLYAKVHFVNFSRKLTVSSVLFLVPLHFLKLGFNGWQIGLIVSSFALAPLLISIPTGWTNDRFSVAGVIRGALLAESLLLLLLAEAKSFPFVVAAFLLLGMANNALDVSLNSLYYKDETEIDQNRKYGTYVFWLGFGPAVGVLGGGLLAEFADFRLLFRVFGLIMFLVFLAVRSYDREKFHVVPWHEYREGLFRKKTLLFMVFLFVLGMHWSVEGTVYSPFLAAQFGLKSFGISVYISTGLFFLSLSAFLVGFMKFNPAVNRRLLLLAMFVSGAGLMLMVNSNLYLSLGFRIAHEIGDGALGALIALFISRLFEKKSIGGSAGVLTAVQILGQMSGALIFSPLGYRSGLQYPFIIAGALLVLNAAYGTAIIGRSDY
jgi:DHA1 family quinolone resistance protein-like MFS transporter